MLILSFFSLAELCLCDILVSIVLWLLRNSDGWPNLFNVFQPLFHVAPSSRNGYIKFISSNYFPCVWVCKFLIFHISRLHRDLRSECFSGIAPLSTSFVRCRAWSTALPLTLVLGEHYRRSLSKHSDILHSLLRKCSWKRKFCSGGLMI